MHWMTWLISSGFSKAMASVVVGGQMMSLLLTLIAIPVLYTYADDVAELIKLEWRTSFKSPPDRGAEEVGVVDLHAVSKTDSGAREHSPH